MSDNQNQPQQSNQGQQNIKQQENIAKSFQNPPTQQEQRIAQPGLQNQNQGQDNGQVKTNPVTTEDIEKQLQQEKQQRIFNNARAEQMNIKMRTEMQGFEYKTPEQFANDPILAATTASNFASETNIQDNNNGQPQATPVNIDPSKGEQVIEVPDQQTTQQQKNAQSLNSKETQPQSRQLKG